MRDTHTILYWFTQRWLRPVLTPLWDFTNFQTDQSSTRGWLQTVYYKLHQAYNQFSNISKLHSQGNYKVVWEWLILNTFSKDIQRYSVGSKKVIREDVICFLKALRCLIFLCKCVVCLPMESLYAFYRDPSPWWPLELIFKGSKVFIKITELPLSLLGLGRTHPLAA